MATLTIKKHLAIIDSIEAIKQLIIKHLWQIANKILSDSILQKISQFQTNLKQYYQIISPLSTRNRQQAVQIKKITNLLNPISF